jgi:hypothetical protein
MITRCPGGLMVILPVTAGGYGGYALPDRLPLLQVQSIYFYVGGLELTQAHAVVVQVVIAECSCGAL